MNLLQVNPNYVCQLWPKVSGMLEKALLTGGGEYNIDQLKVYLTEGNKTLLVVDDNGDIKGAVAITLLRYPNDLICFISAVGGKMITSKDLFSQLENWAKSQGCTKIQGAAFESVARLWRQRFGVIERYRIVEKPL
jgi:hypothetical protein